MHDHENQHSTVDGITVVDVTGRVTIGEGTSATLRDVTKTISEK